MPMLLLDRLAEQQIAAAVRRGDFDDLPGAGTPLELGDDSGVPEALRSGYRLLKNAGCLPPELALRCEIRDVEALLDRVTSESEAAPIRRRLAVLQLRLEHRGGRRNLWLDDGEYRQRLIARLAPD